jgi:hypothetical protein
VTALATMPPRPLWLVPIYRALELARDPDTSQIHAACLCLLSSCQPPPPGRSYHRARRGASYKQLALIRHRVGMAPEERKAFYRLAEEIPLSCWPAEHILDRL